MTFTFTMTLTPTPGHVAIVLLLLCGVLVPSCLVAGCTRDLVEGCLPDHIATIESLEMLKCSTSGQRCIQNLQRSCPGHISLSKIAAYKTYSCSSQGVSDYAALEQCYRTSTVAQDTAYLAARKACNDKLDLQFETDPCNAYEAYDICLELAQAVQCPGNIPAIRFWDKWGDLIEEYYCFSDINECTRGTDNCHVNAVCINTVSSFTCSCKTGYKGDGVVCSDVDECTLGTDNCPTDALCTNTVGSFKCVCNTGYKIERLVCNDVDECTLGIDTCHTNALCTNTVGSFTCSCNTGYKGDGFVCNDVDECTLGTDNCPTDALCVNTVGSFTCVCNTGYKIDRLVCNDVDECTLDIDNCHTDALCTNTVGSFTCVCNTGYKGDGVVCSGAASLPRVTGLVLAAWVSVFSYFYV